MSLDLRLLIYKELLPFVQEQSALTPLNNRFIFKQGIIGMTQGLGIADIDILSNAVIVGDGISQGVRHNAHENLHLSLMMDVLFMILCRKIRSDVKIPQDQSSD